MTEREEIHQRTITFTSYSRPDGLWDLEGVIVDRKSYPANTLEQGVLATGQPYHTIAARLVLNDQLQIVEASASMSITPFKECAAASRPLDRLVGATLGKGWRKAVDDALPRQASCTHMREMLYSAPSAAIQAIPSYRAQKAGLRWPPELDPSKPAPHFIGGCVSWRQDGEVVLRHYPQFYVNREPDSRAE